MKEYSRECVRKIDMITWPLLWAVRPANRRGSLFINGSPVSKGFISRGHPGKNGYDRQQQAYLLYRLDLTSVTAKGGATHAV